MKDTQIKIHIERDYSYVEFDAVIDLETGSGMPDVAVLSDIWNTLPAKNDDTPKTPSAGKSAEARPRREPPATAAQRRLLEKAGEWKDGLTKAQASTILTQLGY